MLCAVEISLCKYISYAVNLTTYTKKMYMVQISTALMLLAIFKT